MQTLNIHDAESVSIGSPIEHNTSRWVTITISYEGGCLEINLFPAKDLPTKDLPITLEEHPNETRIPWA